MHVFKIRSTCMTPYVFVVYICAFIYPCDQYSAYPNQ